MIIKSMARKEASFGQLLAYMADVSKADEAYFIFRNLLSKHLHEMEQEFLRNAAHANKRKNGNFLYHEILSITRAQQLSLPEQKRILREIAYEYIQRRAPDNLVFGVLHDDHYGHLHYHLLISANGLAQSHKTRLTKVAFDHLKKDLEQRVLTHYPQLEQAVAINQAAKEKRSRKAAERKRRTGETPQRDTVKDSLLAIFTQCRDKQALFAALDAAGLSFYARGNTLGVTEVATGRKHRLKTLGMVDAFRAMSERIALDEGKAARTEQTQAQEQTQKQAQPQAATPPSSDDDRAHQCMGESVDERIQERMAEMAHVRQGQKPSQAAHGSDFSGESSAQQARSPEQAKTGRGQQP